MMLVIWRDPPSVDDGEQRVDDVGALDTLLDRLHREAAIAGMPNAVSIYAGNRYPQRPHGKDDRWMPDDPGVGPLPELFLGVGTDDSPLYWHTTGQTEHESRDPRPVAQPEPEYFFEYFYGGQETYATESSLVPWLRSAKPRASSWPPAASGPATSPGAWSQPA